MIEKMKNTKDNLVGKMKETTGKLVNNDRLEMNGKIQEFQSQVGEGIENMKEEMAEKANVVIEGTKRNDKNKKS